MSLLFTGRLNSQLGLMENDSIDLPVPTCTVETTLGGFSNCIFVHMLVIALFHLMAPKRAVCFCKGEDLLQKKPSPTL